MIQCVRPFREGVHLIREFKTSPVQKTVPFLKKQIKNAAFCGWKGVSLKSESNYEIEVIYA